MTNQTDVFGKVGQIDRQAKADGMMDEKAAM
jgi:hypothetical protein